MIRHVISVTAMSFPRPPYDPEVFDADDLADCECATDDTPDEFDGWYLDTVTTALVYHPDTPDTVTMVAARRDVPGQYAPYDFPRLVIEDLLAFSIGSSDDAMFVMARDDANPDWVFVNYLEHPPVYARRTDIENFLNATYADTSASSSFDEGALEALLKGAA